MNVRALVTPEEFKRYIDFAAEVYRQNPYWIPADHHHMVSLLGGQKEAGPHWHAQPFWVESENSIQGTLTAVVDELYNQHWNERTGHLLFFEARPETQPAVTGLFEKACGWLRNQGCNAARTSFLYAWQLPWTIDAYDVIPTIFHTYNPPYYHSYVKNCDFVTEKGMVEYRVTFTPELAARYREMVRRVEAAGVRLRPWNLDSLEDEGRVFAELVNETFATHWGSPQFSIPQMQGFATAMRDVFVPGSVAFAEVDGQAVGFVFSLPDLNQAFNRLGGQPQGEGNFERALREIDHGVLLIIGVKEAFRGQGINLALAAKSYLAMIDRGFRSASYSVVLDDNWPSRRTAEKLGCRVERNFVMYRKDL